MVVVASELVHLYYNSFRSSLFFGHNLLILLKKFFRQCSDTIGHNLLASTWPWRPWVLEGSLPAWSIQNYRCAMANMLAGTLALPR